MSASRFPLRYPEPAVAKSHELDACMQQEAAEANGRRLY
jgi:hypothetical protein